MTFGTYSNSASVFSDWSVLSNFLIWDCLFELFLCSFWSSSGIVLFRLFFVVLFLSYLSPLVCRSLQRPFILFLCFCTLQHCFIGYTTVVIGLADYFIFPCSHCDYEIKGFIFGHKILGWLLWIDSSFWFCFVSFPFCRQFLSLLPGPVCRNLNYVTFLSVSVSGAVRKRVSSLNNHMIDNLIKLQA